MSYQSDYPQGRPAPSSFIGSNGGLQNPIFKSRDGVYWEWNGTQWMRDPYPSGRQPKSSPIETAIGTGAVVVVVVGGGAFLASAGPEVIGGALLSAAATPLGQLIALTALRYRADSPGWGMIGRGTVMGLLNATMRAQQDYDRNYPYPSRPHHGHGSGLSAPQYVLPPAPWDVPHHNDAAAVAELIGRGARLMANLALAGRRNKNKQASLGARDMALLDYTSTFSSGGALVEIRSAGGHPDRLARHKTRRLHTRATVHHGTTSSRAGSLAWARAHGDIPKPAAGLGSTVYHGPSHISGATSSYSGSKKTGSTRGNYAAGDSFAAELTPR